MVRGVPGQDASRTRRYGVHGTPDPAARHIRGATSPACQGCGLDDRETAIMHNMATGEKSWADMAASFRVSKPRMSQLVARTKEKLRKKLAGGA